MTSVDVVTLGECMVALRCRGAIRLGAPMETSIAGAESNVAIGLARLGHASRWVGRVGADESGELVRRVLRAEQVAVDQVLSDPTAATGLLIFEQRLPDITRVEYHRAGSAGSLLAPGDVVPTLLEGHPRLLHVTGVTAALGPTALDAVRGAVETARAAGVVVSLDVNYRRSRWDISAAGTALRPLAELADIVIASEDELLLVADGPAELLARGPREVIVKLGGDGAAAYTQDQEGAVRSAASQVQVVDSIGAGDAFCAGYLSGWLDGLELPERLRRANAVAGFAVATPGDWEGLPIRSELALVAAPAGLALR
jgi:2-dehydro-3-deoxygluconokinase